LAVAIQEVPRIIIFSFPALFVVSVTATQRSAAESLRYARDDLGRTVQELGRLNGALQTENAERRRAEEALEDLAGRLIHAQEEERRRIGRELHDHVSQMLGVLTIKIDPVRAREESTPGIGAALDELRRDASDIADDVHRLSHRLHSSTLDYLGLVPALQKLVSEFCKRHDIAITFAHTSVAPSLPSDVALCLFRVAEESLTNIAKHSRARSANVHVTGEPDGIHLRIEDAGTGFDMTTLQRKAGLGFVSMQERLRVLHGTIHVDSAPSRGTRIDAWVPAMMPARARDRVAQESQPDRGAWLP
jgi:signal transduction histidine kinase